MFVEEQIKPGPPGEVNQAREINMWSELLGKAIEAKTLNEFMRNQVCFFVRDGWKIWWKNRKLGSSWTRKKGSDWKKPDGFFFFLALGPFHNKWGTALHELNYGHSTGLDCKAWWDLTDILESFWIPWLGNWQVEEMRPILDEVWGMGMPGILSAYQAVVPWV